jgi:serine protease Do
MSRLIGSLGSALALSVFALTSVSAFPSQDRAQTNLGDSQIGRSFQVPYHLTETKHFLVRVRINGKGPFNFLVDSGAPALVIPTGTARRIGLNSRQDRFWTPVDRLDIEGGARLEGIKARVEDPFQLVGMNALGLAGASIDGILGFTILARFRLEIDPTRDRMIWTRLNYQPRDPVPDHKPEKDKGAPREIQAMNALGPIAKGLAFLMGKQPEDEQRPRGFLGLEWVEQVNADQTTVRVTSVLEASPAAAGGLQSGDHILQINGRTVTSRQSARVALAEIQPGDTVHLLIRRRTGASARELALTLTAGEGL